MNQSNPQSDARVATNEGGSPSWVAFALVTSSYFVVLFGVVTYCLVLP